MEAKGQGIGREGEVEERGKSGAKEKVEQVGT